MGDIDEIIDFIVKYYPFYKNQESEVRYAISLHLKYKTCMVVRDEKGIVSVVRWNISPDGETAHLLDWIIRPDCRNQGLGRRMLLELLKGFPNVKKIKFEREVIRPNGESTIWSVEEILERKI